jgi:hypothetical protein
VAAWRQLGLLARDPLAHRADRELRGVEDVAAKRFSVTAAGLSALALVVTVGSEGRAALARSSDAAPRVTRTSSLAWSSPCDHGPIGRLVYHWPIRPFDQQHPIRGNFGDPRTVTSAALGMDTETSPGSFTFHNGIDISAPTGTPVYPVVSGVVDAKLYADEVSVDTGEGRVFQYFHIAPQVRVGQQVFAYRTVLGRTLPYWLHVHFGEIDGFRVHNPADPGHLEPYRDTTAPEVHGLVFRAEDGRDIEPGRLRGKILIAADAEDFPSPPVPGEWFGHPVTPALVSWRMATTSGRPVVPQRTVADFRHTEPPNRDFWLAYAAGTYQNFPVFAHHYFFDRPGRYLFNLTPSPLDTTRLGNGVYVLTVDVADVCGNRGSFSEWVRLDNRA